MVNKYEREIVGLDGTVTTVDVYRVLNAFEVESAQLQHLTKKALCAGIRGHKGEYQDLLGIRESIDSAILEFKQRLELDK